MKCLTLCGKKKKESHLSLQTRKKMTNKTGKYQRKKKTVNIYNNFGEKTFLRKNPKDRI